MTNNDKHLYADNIHVGIHDIELYGKDQDKMLLNKPRILIAHASDMIPSSQSALI